MSECTEAIEKCEEIRHTLEFKELYKKRKEPIERVFGTAKEFHGLRYTNLKGKEKMHMKIGLTFACLNMKKLAKIMTKKLRNKLFRKEKKVFQAYISLFCKKKDKPS